MPGGRAPLASAASAVLLGYTRLDDATVSRSLFPQVFTRVNIVYTTRKDLFAWRCLAIIPTTKQQAIGSSLNNIVCLALFGCHTNSQATKRFQRAVRLAEIIVSDIAAVTTEPKTCRLTIFVDTTYTSK
jgi:hypothetical protein